MHKDNGSYLVGFSVVDKENILLLPDTIEDIPIRINPQHDVLHGCVMDERALGVDEEHVRNPNLLHQTGVEGATLVAAGGEGQPIVLPVVPQVQGHGEILRGKEVFKPSGEKETLYVGVLQESDGHIPCSLQIYCQCSPPGRLCQQE